jgi:glycogen debranching enzyme
VWPWLIGPYVESVIRTGGAAHGLLDGLVAHLSEWGLGSVSETADADAPHGATGCPFQAWSVAELMRARRLLHR